MLATPGSPTFATSVASAGARRTQRSNVAPTSAASRKTSGMIPLGAGQDRDVGMVGIEVARVLVRLHDEGRSRAEASGRRGAAGVVRGEECADECARVETGGDEDVDEPASSRALAVCARDTDQPPPDGRIRDDLLPGLDRDPRGTRSLQLRRVRVDRGQRLGDGQAIGVWERRDVRRCVLWRDPDAERVKSRRVRRRSARVTRSHDRARPGSEDRSRTRARPSGPHDVDPLSGPDLSCRPRRRQTRGHPFGGGRHPSVASSRPAASTRSMRSSSAATALWRLFSDLSPLQT